jgi:DNA-binding LytR/AlgR family response regulator
MRDFLFLKNNSKYSRIFFNDLQYIEASDKYVRFITTDKTFMALGSLNQVEKRLPTDQFIRIHRSYIVSLRHTCEFTSEIVCIADQKLPLSRQYRTAFFEKAAILFADEIRKLVVMKSTG